MFNKLKSLLVVFMLVFISACYDFNDLDGGSTDPNPNPVPDPNPNPGLPETEVTPVNNVYEISTMEELIWIANKSVTDNFTGKIVRFIDDIDMKNIKFSGIKKFAGRLEGNDKAISNLKIGDGTSRSIGLINVLETGGYIDNLTIASGYIHGLGRYGAFVGDVSGASTIKGVKNHANVGKLVDTGTGLDNSVGGLVGFSQAALTIEDSLNTGKITSLNIIGGLVGMSNDVLIISNSSNTGKIEGKSRIGGLVGNGLKTTIYNSVNSGMVKGAKLTGGIIGNSEEATTILNSVNKGDISNVGLFKQTGSYVGGLVGFCGKSIVIDNSSNRGNINSIADEVGGIIGGCRSDTLDDIVNIDNSSNSGKIVGASTVGGIIGVIITTNLNIDNSSNSGDIEGTSKVGGIIGGSFSNISLINVHSYATKVIGVDNGGIIGSTGMNAITTATNSYWLHDAVAEETTPGTGGIANAVGSSYSESRTILPGTSALDLAKFKVADNFIGWNFTPTTGIWIMGTDYPTLINLPVAKP